MNNRWSVWCVAVLCILSSAPPTPAAAPTVAAAKTSVDDLFAAPEISQLRFSPNGRYLAGLVPIERRLNLVVMDMENMSKKLVTRLTDEGIADYLWANDDRLLFFRDEGGRENYGLYGVNRTGGGIDRLAYAGEQRGVTVHGRFSGLLRRQRDNPQRVLILANETVRDRPDVASMDINTGSYHVLTPNPGNVATWVLDWNDVTRFGVAEQGGKTSILYRERQGEAWTTVATFNEGEQSWAPLAFDRDNRIAYIASNVSRKTTAVYRYDTVTHQIGAAVCHDDTYDVVGPFAGNVLTSMSRRSAVGVAYQADRPKVVYWDAEYEQRQGIIDRSLPGMTNRQVATGENNARVLIHSSSDRDPGVFYLYQSDRKRIEQLAVIQPRVDPEKMSPMQPVSFAARDGRELHGYLTLPLNVGPQGLPLIVHPHGGPYGPRDVWSFDPEVQFYAARGFAVLQVNYRGSGGYGLGFEQAGYRQWGLAMQHDLSDGVKWAVAQGLVDPARVIISGASYGGYAVMAGLTLTPELYCGGINYVGVTDLVLRADAFRGSTELRRWHSVHIGDVDGDRKQLRDTSPVNFAERIRVPLLMGYGKNDPRVPIEHCYEMERALKRAHKAYEVVIEEDEGHGFRKEETAVAFYRRIDRFLTANFPWVSN
ncbi:MAG: S9 family peptidase [Opitutus sp.]